MKKTAIISIAIVFVLMTTTFAVLPRASADMPLVDGTSARLRDNVYPKKTTELSAAELDTTPSDPVPFNVDMVNAETTANDGTGIYVAVLDTGLLSNWVNFFPPGTVNIDTADGIGFTHDVFFVGSGGNFSDDGHFSYGPLRNDRGFLTHDVGNPNPAPNPYHTGLGSGHGTHVTSIITGYHFVRGTVNTFIRGVAPKVTIIPVLVLDDWLVPDYIDMVWKLYTGGTDEMVAAGIRYIGDLAAAKHIKIIINMSLGGSGYTQEELDAIDYAIAQGVIIVASAGNSGEAGMGWPGAFPQVISAAAAGWTQEYGGGYYDYYWWWRDVPEKLNTNNYVYDLTTGITYKNNWQTYLTDFSSRANKALGQSWKDLDVAAPGAAIRGPYKGYGTGQWAYYAVWGTSQAAPHVSGTAALVAQTHPNLMQAEMESILKKAATRIPMPADGAIVSDVFGAPAPPYPVYPYYWNDHDAGCGFLAVDEALKVAG